MRRKEVVYGLFAGLLLTFGSCVRADSGRRAEVRVGLHTVERSESAAVQDFPGRVVASEEVNMAFKLSGTLMQVHVGEGSRVRRGQLVAELDPRDYRLQLEAAEAEYLNVKSEAERVMALYADSVGTADAYDKARFGLRQIGAKYENARNQLADTKIYAPFDGSVQKRLFDPPAVVAAGMPVVTLVSDGGCEIEINIPASTYVQRSRIAAFTTTFDFLGDRNIPLRLIGVAPKANANQLYSVRLAVPGGLTPEPSPGMSVMVQVWFDDAQSGKRRIPASALFEQDGTSCVWVYDEDAGVVRRRAVTVERLATAGWAIVTQGVEAGERIVTAGVNKLTDGQAVRPLAAATQTNVGGLL